MSGQSEPQRVIRSYFVDEAGDGTLFDRKGRVIVGTQGCSRFFILGLADIADPTSLGRDLGALRTRLLADPYFQGVPSMRPDARKTALAFHAKDDLPEIRREVFSLLSRHQVSFMAAVKNKQKLLQYVRERNLRDPSYRYNLKELYDFLVRRLFREKLHKDDRYDICFAKRWKSDRTAALRAALYAARSRFAMQHGVASDAAIEVITGSPRESPCLQAVDYFLWALQRLYERREERYLAAMWGSVRLVVDIDDTREAPYGTYYTQRKPLTVAALESLQGI